MNDEDRRLAAGVGQPELPHTGPEICRGQPSRVLRNGGVADDLDNQVGRSFDFHVAARFAVCFRHQAKPARSNVHREK